jgi:hypothetical protein
MVTRRRSPVLVHAALLFVAGAMAVRSAAAAHYPVELVPIVGIRGGADLEADVPAVPPATASPRPSFGLTVDWFVRPDAWFELLADHQTLEFTSDPSSFGTSGFDFAVDYLQFGGGYGPAEGRVRPYVVAGLGLTRYGASSGDVGSTIGASGSLGGGLKVPIGKRVSLRFEVRGYATATDAAVSVACGPGCFVQFSAGGWFQLGATAGLAIRL